MAGGDVDATAAGGDKRVDLLACSTAQGARGTSLIAHLEKETGVNWAASTDATGSGEGAENGLDFVMETEEEELSGSLLDARYSFLGHCQTSHWQFDDLERAHYTTMMILAMLLKAPAADSRPPSAMAEGLPSGSGFHSMPPMESVNLEKCSCTAGGLRPFESTSTRSAAEMK